MLFCFSFLGYSQDESLLNRMKNGQTYTLEYYSGGWWNQSGGSVVISKQNGLYYCQVFGGAYSENKKFVVSDQQLMDLKNVEKEILTGLKDKRCNVKMRYKIKVGTRKIKLTKCSDYAPHLIKDWMRE